jgi:uncharacterized protein YjiS (DUF1127 family)
MSDPTINADVVRLFWTSWEPYERERCALLAISAFDDATAGLSQRLGADMLIRPDDAPDAYLRRLGHYRVHVVGDSVRGIIESVAVGATPVTTLPKDVILPEIDGALERVEPGAAIDELVRAVEWADTRWHRETRHAYALKAMECYSGRTS